MCLETHFAMTAKISFHYLKEYDDRCNVSRPNYVKHWFNEFKLFHCMKKIRCKITDIYQIVAMYYFRVGVELEGTTSYALQAAFDLCFACLANSDAASQDQDLGVVVRDFKTSLQHGMTKTWTSPEQQHCPKNLFSIIDFLDKLALINFVNLAVLWLVFPQVVIHQNEYTTLK